MKIILATNAITPPLSGIGRYTYELAIRLPHEPEIKSLKFFAHGKLVPPPDIHALQQVKLQTKSSLTRTILRNIAAIPFLRPTSDRLTIPFSIAKLNRESANIFHSPNFTCPHTNIPTVVTIHDLSTMADKTWQPASRRRYVNYYLPKVVAFSRVILTDADSVRFELLERYPALDESKVVTIPLGVDISFRPWQPQDEQVLFRHQLTRDGYSLFISTIEPRKNLERLIRAYRCIHHELKQMYPLVLSGGRGWNDDSIRVLIKQAEQEGWLKYLGYTADADLPALYAGARAFLYPSLYEGFGLPIAEAMASGVPVLTSNCSSMPEVAAGAACLIDPTNEEAIQVGIEQVLTDNDFRDNAIQKGLNRAAELTWESCIKKTVKAYQLAIQES